MMRLILALAFLAIAKAGDINRQSIVFHEETPDVFYCPQEKPISLEGMIVKAKPLDALCEHEGRGLPENYKSDCWNDVDETEYACQEKKRILLHQPVNSLCTVGSLDPGADHTSGSFILHPPGRGPNHGVWRASSIPHLTPSPLSGFLLTFMPGLVGTSVGLESGDAGADRSHH